MDNEQDNYVLNDESVTNSHGFVLLNAAGRFERFNQNPVMLFNHDSSNLIGQMTDLKVEGTKLIGSAKYDEEDPLALKCKRQAKCGILKGCSPGIIINSLEERIAPDGSSQLTVTDWELCEVSLVSVPSNRNALKLYNQSGEPISDDMVKMNIDNLLKSNNNDEMDKLILTAEAYMALDLKSNEADGKAISAAVMELKARFENAEKELENAKKQKAEDLVSLAVKEGRITADLKEQFLKLALLNYDLAKGTLESIPGKETLMGMIVHTGNSTSQHEGWNYLKWAKEDPEGLKKLKTDDPDAFAELKKHIN